MLHPVRRRVLIRPVMPSNESESGLTLVRNYQPIVMGDVVAVGEDVKDVLIGERVLFSDTVGQEVRLDEGQAMLLMDERDVSAVLTADPEACPYCRRPLEAAHG